MFLRNYFTFLFQVEESARTNNNVEVTVKLD